MSLCRRSPERLASDISLDDVDLVAFVQLVYPLVHNEGECILIRPASRVRVIAVVFTSNPPKSSSSRSCSLRRERKVKSSDSMKWFQR